MAPRPYHALQDPNWYKCMYGTSVWGGLDNACTWCRNLVHVDWIPLISKPPSDGVMGKKCWNTIYIYSDDYKTITKIALRIYKIKTGSCNQVNCRSLHRSISWRRFNSGLPSTIGDILLLTTLANLLGLSLAMMSRRSLSCIQQEHAVAALLAQ